jgi:FHA domain-containing protein
MDIIRRIRRFESRIAETVDAATQRMPPATREPLEIVHDIVEAVEKRVEPAGRGKYVFPFNQVTIRIAAASREIQARFEAVVGSEPCLKDRILQTLDSAGCDSATLMIDTVYVDQPEAGWTAPQFNMDFERIAIPAQTPQPQILKLTTLWGTSDEPTYVFTMSRINLGRCRDIRDNRNRLIRTNHVAFAETGEPNLSVSRNHAHIDRVGALSEFRLCDDRSAHGTTLLRNGLTIPVPQGSRGVRVQSGDEIALGEVRLHVEIAPGDIQRLFREKPDEET